MKKLSQILLPMLVLATLLLSACTGATAPANTSGSKVDASLVDFTGVIEAINGDQWVVSGQSITVDPSVVRDGPYNVGDTIKVEAEVKEDGSIVVTRVETPSADDNANDDNSNDVDNANDDNSNDVDNSNDDNSNEVSNTNDDDDNINDANSNDDDNDDNTNVSSSNDNDDSDDDDDNSNDDSDDSDDDSDDDNSNNSNNNGG